MKLYTEEEIMNYLINHKSTIIRYDLQNIPHIELPSDEETLRWWQTQDFQKEQGEQEYTMLYEIDLPKILKAFIEHFIKTGGNK
jgi:hypothetical protein